MKFRCGLFIEAKCCFGFCLSDTSAAVTRRPVLEWGNNGKLNYHALCWNTWADHTVRENTVSASLGVLNLNQGGKQGFIPSALVNNPHSTPKYLRSGKIHVQHSVSPSPISYRRKTNERHFSSNTSCCSEHHCSWIFKWKWKLCLFPWVLFVSFMHQTCVSSDQ